MPSPAKKSVAIIGAGVTGLSAATKLKRIKPHWQISLFESGARPGGWIGTEQIEGCLVETGPESLIRQPKNVLDLTEELGLTDRIVGTNPAFRGAYIVSHGKLVRIPHGFRMIAPTSFLGLLRSPVLSLPGRARALIEPWLPFERAPEHSVREFITQRFGYELFEKLAEPMVAGVYGGDPAKLSMNTVMPRFAELASEYGSVVKGLKASEPTGKPSTGARYDLFFSFRSGLQELVDAMVDPLRSQIHCDSPVTGITVGNKWTVRMGNGTSNDFDGVVVTASSTAASRLIEFDSELNGALAEIEYGSSAVVTAAWPKDQLTHPLDAYGFVVPKREGRFVIASTWSSQKYPGRAPTGQALLRFYVDEDGIAACDSDNEIIERCLGDIRDLVGMRQPPDWTRIDWMQKAMPRYYLGHEKRVNRIEQCTAKHEGLEFAGNAYRGVGIAASVASAGRAVASLAKSLEDPVS